MIFPPFWSAPAVSSGGFIGVTEGATVSGGTTASPHVNTQAGDALVFVCVHQFSSTFGISAGWDAMGLGQDSSGGLKIVSYGRVADGTASDSAVYTMTSGPTMWVMYVLRGESDSHFPASMVVNSDYNSSLAGAGACNVGSVTKPSSGDQFAIIVGYFESTYALGVGMELTAPPSGYTLAGNQTMGFTINGTPFYCQLLGGYRTFNGTSENAGAFTAAPSQDVGGGGTGALALVITYTP